MKRKRSIGGNGGLMRKNKKKMKREKVEKGEEEVAVVEERRDGAERVVAAVAAAEVVMNCDEWPWLESDYDVVVDEEMSWGTFWSPFWELGFVGEGQKSQYCDDVVWEDDIWNLKAIKEVPNP